MRKVICKRCGRENEVSEDVLELHKCPQCENAKFDRQFFVPIEKQVIEDFKKAKASKFGPILKSLYLFGSYAKKELQCGDIDFLITYSEPKLMEFTRSEIESFHSQFDFFFPEEYSLPELKSILKESFWDFRTCQEYPDCLTCYMEPTCRLPSEDYHSDFHTYCLDRCKSKNTNSIPSCCFGDCTFLKMSIRNQILGKIGDILKEANVEFYEVSSGLKIKVLDLVRKRRIKELEEEFKHQKEKKDFQLYRINPLNGRKTRVRKRKKIDKRTIESIGRCASDIQNFAKKRMRRFSLPNRKLILLFLFKTLMNEYFPEMKKAKQEEAK